MKTLGKYLLPELHFNPITRDLLVVIMASLLVAVAFATVGVMIANQF